MPLNILLIVSFLLSDNLALRQSYSALTQEERVEAWETIEKDCGNCGFPLPKLSFDKIDRFMGQCFSYLMHKLSQSSSTAYNQPTCVQ